MNEHHELLTTKIGLILGSAGVVGLRLTEVDLIFGIVLKFISIVSFAIVIIINIDKCEIQIKKWLKKK